MGATSMQLAIFEWTSDQDVPFDWVGTLGAWGAVLFGALFVVSVVRGLTQAKLYRATDVLDDSDRDALASEIADAETKTSGEIAVVVLERSDRHPGADWLAGVVTVALGSVLLAPWLPWDHPGWLLCGQFGLGVAGFVAARLIPGFKRFFVSSARADEMAREQALQEFYALGLHRTADATGVLLFVSLFERRSIVLGDEGIDAVLEASDWEATDRAILDGVAAGELSRGLRDGVRRCADVLAEHFPRADDDADELPNHVIVRAE